MRLYREFKVWGGDVEEKDAIYIWAVDMDAAFRKSRYINSTMCAAQWTGRVADLSKRRGRKKKMIVNIKSRYCEGKIEASKESLNTICLYMSEVADYLKADGYNARAKEAREIAQEIYDALDAKGYFNNVK